MAQVKLMIWNKTTNQVVNDNYVMDSANLPIQGLDPNYEAYIFNTPNKPAPVDARKFKIVENRERTTTPHPLFAGYNQYLITYTEELWSKSELIIEVKNREKQANAMLYNGYDMTELNTKGYVINSKRIKKNTLETWELEIETVLANIAAAIQNNYNIREQMITAITANQAFDLDFGWIYSL